MKIAILAFVALAVALPTSLQPRVSLVDECNMLYTETDIHFPQQQEDVNPVSSSSTPESLLDAIPVNLVASIRRPNGDVIVSIPHQRSRFAGATRR